MTKTDNNIIDSIKNTFLDRLKDPFVGSFVISWTLWNWKAIVYVIFGEGFIVNRMDAVPDEYMGWWVSLSLPLITAIIIPLLAALVNLVVGIGLLWIEEKRQKQKIDSLGRIAEENMKLSFIESGFSINNYELNLSTYKKIINRLKELNQSIISHSKDVNSKYNNVISTLSKTQFPPKIDELILYNKKQQDYLKKNLNLNKGYTTIIDDLIANNDKLVNALEDGILSTSIVDG